MSTENKILAIAGINPSDRRCCFVGEQSVENIMSAISDGLIVVPVSAETASEVFNETVDDLCAIAR